MNLELSAGCTPSAVSGLRGELAVPGDKSITHRALLLSALADGPSRIRRFLDGGDCRATMACLGALGTRIERLAADELLIEGAGPRGWQEPEDVLNCGRSGTTMRLLVGLLAGQRFYSVLNGEPQLRRRPMDRVVAPLRAMGARLEGRGGGRLPPLSIIGSPLQGVAYTLPVASAQVKSCVLLAGLYAEGTTTVIEPGPSRDHTERMLRARDVPVERLPKSVRLRKSGGEITHSLAGPVEALAPRDVLVPGDFSSAAFFLVGALLLPKSDLLLRDVGVNPTRTGLLDVLRAMGARVELRHQREEGGEPVADLYVRGQELVAAGWGTSGEIGGELVPRMIDEFPILALAATQAQGVTRVRGAAELRVKESDRIAAVVTALRTLGARIEAAPDGFDVEGPTPLRGAPVDCAGDHRLAMTLAMAALIARGETKVPGAECIADSVPGFEEQLRAVIQTSEV